MIDSMIKDKIKENVNMTVPLYLMMSYAYYKQDNPIAKAQAWKKLAETSTSVQQKMLSYMKIIEIQSKSMDFELLKVAENLLTSNIT